VGCRLAGPILSAWPTGAAASERESAGEFFERAFALGVEAIRVRVASPPDFATGD
jgi:hypothetical protein